MIINLASIIICIIIFIMICYYTDHVDILIFAVYFFWKGYVVVRDKLYALEDSVMGKHSKSERKRFLQLLLIGEIVIIPVTLLLAGDKAQWAYSILSATPVGGILNFFYNPGEFAVGTNLLSWLLSGLQFLMITAVVREVNAVESSKWLQLLHSMLFTFSSGALVALLVNYAVSPLLQRTQTAFETYPLVLKLIPLLLQIGFSLVGLLFFIISVRAFLDNVKILLVVLAFELLVISILNPLYLFLVSGAGEHTELLSRLVYGLNYFVFELPAQRSFWAQLAMTVILTAVYNVGILVFGNVRGMVKEAVEDYKEQERKEELEKEEKKRKKKVRYTEPVPDAVSRTESTGSGTEDMLFSVLQRDAKERYFTGKQRKLYKMSVRKLCKTYGLTPGLLHRMREDLVPSDFAKKRVNYVPDYEAAKTFLTRVEVAVLFPFIAFLLVGRFQYVSFLYMIGKGTAYFAMAGFWYLVFGGIGRLFRKDRKARLSDSWIAVVIWVISAAFSFMTGGPAFTWLCQAMWYWSILAAAFASAALYGILELYFIRRHLLGLTVVRNCGISELYKQFEKEMNGVAPAAVKYKLGKQWGSAVIGCCARYDELTEYLTQNS